MDNYVLPTKPKPSEKYLELIEAYKHLHEDDDKFQGISLIPFAIDIWNIIKFNKCKSIIDYGCGKAAILNHLKVKQKWHKNDGEKIVVQGKGKFNYLKGEQSDLVFILRQKHHDKFYRKGKDLLYKKTISNVLLNLPNRSYLYKCRKFHRVLRSQNNKQIW